MLSARRALLAAGLIAYEAQLYQVLSLQPTPAPAVAPSAPRAGEPLHLSEVLRQLFAASAAASESSPRPGGTQS
ncbi:MAG: hypothetical protein JSR82_05835 [Verrucomicrobia bacterium]|nr:hypothetical protein [Verrucomicrobiota bacterium]